MPIELFTGQPGNGKTAFMVERLIAETKKEKARPIWAGGINGLAPGLASELSDPKEWSKIIDYTQGPCECSLVGGDMVNGKYRPHTHMIPPGSLIFIDEAWKWFGHLQDARHQSTPKHVLDLAEHRHMGVDFVWTTQMPAQLFPFVRGLIARHTHVVRRFGTKFVDLFTWEELNEDVKSGAKRENAQKVVRTLPDQVFSQYKSAMVHTIKRRLPMKLFVLPVAVVLAVVLLYYGINAFRPSAVTERITGKGTDSALAEAAPLAGNPSPKSVEPMSVVEYVERQQPRIPLAPWSAPLYDERSATVDPQLFCMSAQPGEGRKQECTCMTEQGTRYQIRAAMCEEQARHGPIYNPFKERREEREFAHVGQVADVPESRRNAFGAGALGMGEPGFPARYGQFRNEPQGPRNYEVQGW